MPLSLGPLTPPPGPTPTGGPPVVIATPSSSIFTSISDTQSSTTSSSSSSYVNTTNTSSSNSSQKGLSAGAGAGLAVGIVFFLILSVLLFYNLKGRYQRAREQADDEPALVTTEVSRYLPLQSVASRGRNPLPPSPPRSDTEYPASAHISSAATLGSHQNSYPVSAQNRHSTLSRATGPQRIATQDVPDLPNPHDPFSAPARPASYYSRAHSIPHNASASAAVMASFDLPAVGTSRNSQSERQLSALHADMARHQKELELEYKNRSFDQAQELQEPPPQYPS
ncbi:hypothetical protein EV424DRAFT_642744 [Suillus variegatus]|nr:hypothetical protein EV424DRAFT_642744 [Suillus variegatus]